MELPTEILDKIEVAHFTGTPVCECCGEYSSTLLHHANGMYVCYPCESVVDAYLTDKTVAR